jgi:hypothetical protein
MHYKLSIFSPFLCLFSTVSRLDMLYIFFACITLDLISMSSVPLVSKITLNIYIFDNCQFRSLYLISNCCQFPQYINILFYLNSCQGFISRKFLLIYASYTPNHLCHTLKLLNHLQTGVYTILYFLEEFPYRRIYVSILLKLYYVNLKKCRGSAILGNFGRINY